MRDQSLEELRYNDLHRKGATPTQVCRDPLRKSLSVPDRQMEILDILLNDSSIRSTINYLVRKCKWCKCACVCPKLTTCCNCCTLLVYQFFPPTVML